jgi:hypothetical protein
LWRRYHHDEWGTGNYHADTRPPAALRAADVAVNARPDGGVDLHLAAVPGDDLYCGDTTVQVRWSDTPIENAAAFDAASQASIDALPPAGRNAAALVARAAAWRNREVHLAVAAIDDAGNRSPVLSLGAVDFRPEESDDGCAVTAPSSSGGAGLWMIALLGVLAARVIWPGGAPRRGRGGPGGRDPLDSPLGAAAARFAHRGRS